MKQVIRYKRIIKIFKTLLIISMFIVLSLVYNWSETKDDGSLRIAEASNAAKLEQKYEANMQNFTYYGTSGAQSSYKIIAETAVKLSDYEYNLQTVFVEYVLPTNNLLIKSKHARIIEDQSVILTDSVRVRLGEVECVASLMNVNLINNIVTSDAQVAVHYNKSHILADTLKADTNNNIIELRGNIKSKINSSDF